MTFYNELAVAFCGQQNDALGAWLMAGLRVELPLVAARTEAYFAAMDEDQAADLAVALGWQFSSMPARMPRPVLADFQKLVDAADTLLAE